VARTRRRPALELGVSRSSLELQWSRRANATETAIKEADEARIASFNGAVARTRRRRGARARLAPSPGSCNGAAARRRLRRPGSEAKEPLPGLASMEPSRERDGDTPGPGTADREHPASMEPSRERDGDNRLDAGAAD